MDENTLCLKIEKEVDPEIYALFGRGLPASMPMTIQGIRFTLAPMHITENIGAGFIVAICKVIPWRQ